MIRVMVVDDSPLVRRIVTDVLNADPNVVVVATAAKAEFALAKLHRERPDVITMDLEMEGMGGIEAIRRIMEERPTPIIVVSAYARHGAESTMQALELGAVDFVVKPSGNLYSRTRPFELELVDKVRSAGGLEIASTVDRTADDYPNRQLRPLGVYRTPSPAALSPIVGIGASTGGPVALKNVIERLPAGLPAGIVIVQHMPPVFTRAFAERLNASSNLVVREAVDGDAILPGTVLLAPGNWHMSVRTAGAGSVVALGQESPVNGHRPSVDVLMRSVAQTCGDRAIGVIMTGMGKDGAAGIHALREAGGRIIAQDQKSSIIFGMNREVILAGDADEVVPLEAIAQRITEAVMAFATPQEVSQR